MTERLRLRHISEVVTSNVDKLKSDNEIPVRLINYTDVYYGDRLTPDIPLMRATASASEIVKHRIAAGDVLITKDSETADDIGVAAYVETTSDDLVCGYHLSRIRADRSRIDPRYLFWALTGSHARDQMSVAATGVTRFGLRADSIRDLAIRVPPLAKQRAIADYLDTETSRIDTLITKKRRMIELLEERLRITARESTTRSGAVGPLRRFVRGVKTGTTPPAGELDDLRGSDVAWYSPGDVGPNLRMHTPARSLNLRTLSEGWTPDFPADSTLIVGIGATAGRVGHNVSRSTGNQQMTCITPSVRVLPRFLSWQLWARADELRETAPYTTLPILNNDFLRSVSIVVPSLDMQEGVVRRLDRSADLLLATDESLRTQIGLLAERRQALITEAVTGEFAGPADR